MNSFESTTKNVNGDHEIFVFSNYMVTRKSLSRIESNTNNNSICRSNDFKSFRIIKEIEPFL